MQRNRAALKETENTFRAMSAQDTAAAKPWVLRSTALPRGGFAELATRLLLTTLPEQQLKLINGVYSGGNVATGAAVKMVVQ